MLKSVFKLTVYFFAIIGLLTSCLIGSTIFLPNVNLVQRILFFDERSEVKERYLEFCHAFLANDYESAFTYMAPEYRQQNTVETFQSDPGLQEAIEYTFECDFSTLGVIRVGTDPDEPLRMEIWPREQLPFGSVYNSGFELIEIDGEWYFTGRGWFYLD